MQHIRVTAGIICRDDKILICQRHHTARQPLKWEFPGGKIEPDEAPAACLIRELKEELAIDTTIGELLAEQHFEYPAEELSVLLYFFEIADFSGEIHNHVFERIEWVRPIDLLDYDFLEADIEFVRKIAADW